MKLMFSVWFQTLTVSPKAAHFLVLQPEDVLQPISFVEVGETGQSTDQNCRQGEERNSSQNIHLTLSFVHYVMYV